MYCLSRPESYLEVLPSKDQDDLSTKNKGRQRASESRLNFHIGGPHIHCPLPKLYDCTEFETFRNIVAHTER